MIFIKQGVPLKRIKKFELETAESICLEITISRRKWIMFSIYRPQSFHLQRFFQELVITVDKATNAYDNVIIMGDINIDTSCTTAAGYTKIEDFMDIFGFENLIKDKTCHASTKGSSTDIILTNRKRSFKNSCCVETGLSNHHTMILTSLKAHFT